MKKLKLLLATLMSATCLTACGNHHFGLGSFEFHYVHVQMYGMEPTHLKVKEWQSDNGGIELHTESHGTILLGDGTYMMYDTEKCPLCGEVSYK